MEITSVNTERDDDDDELLEPSSKKKRNLPSKFKDFLQSWMDKTPSKEETAEKDDDTEHNWLKSFGKLTLKLLGVGETKAEPEQTQTTVEAQDLYSVDKLEESDADLQTLYEKEPHPDDLDTVDQEIEITKEELSIVPEEETQAIEDETNQEPSPEILSEIEDTAAERLPETNEIPTTVYEHGHLVHPETQENPTYARKTASPATHNPGSPRTPVNERQHYKEKETQKSNKLLEKQQTETQEAKSHLADKYQELQQQIKQVAKKLELPDRRREFRQDIPEKQSVAERAKPTKEVFLNPQYKTKEKLEKQPEWTTPETTSINSATPEKIKQMVASPERFATPETLLYQVEKAAEENIPLEKLYERRQEIKDAENAFTSSRSLSSNNSWLKPSAPPELTVPMPRVSSGNKLADIWKDQPEMYQQAVKGSASAALLVVIVITIMMVVFR